jgi:hypothetical protein
MVSPYDNGDHAKVEGRRWRAVTLSNRGLTHRMIAEQMADRKRVDQGLEEKLAAATLRLNDIRRQLYRIIASDHYVLANGKIVKDDEGRPLKDNAPVLAALAQLRALEEQQARLEGTNAREKIDIALERRVDEESTDVVEAILAGFSAVPELEPAVRQRVLEAAGAHLRGPEGPGDDGIEDAEIVE